jgi:dipeptidyl aminopeptidase/acylaminoacyl peptidase
MKKKIYIVSLTFILIQTLANGQITQKTYSTIGKVEIVTPFAKQGEFMKFYYDSIYYEKARLTKKFECLKLSYKSDTATVEAWLYKPVKTTKRLPIIIYNRGGMGNFGNLVETNLVDFHKMAENGYLVIATKTRFAGTNGKYDQHGGIDVDDIVNLASIYESFPYADTSNVFMYGFSRGGQNTYQASLKMKLNAMVVTASVTDWLRRVDERKEFVEGWDDDDKTQTYEGFAKVFSNWKTDSIQILKDRSAYYWADKINTPVLILHSRQDPRVPCYNALIMATKLQEFNKEYEMIIYDEPSHSLPFSKFDSYDKMFAWFEKHKEKTTNR